MNKDYGPPDLEPRAITWSEYMRGGGGGGSFEPPREPTKLGRVFRDWACALIQNKFKKIENEPTDNVAAYFSVRKKHEELTRRFNRISGEPGFLATLDAVRVILHLPAPARN